MDLDERMFKVLIYTDINGVYNLAGIQMKAYKGTIGPWA